MSRRNSIDTEELSRFSSQNQDWWNPEGVWRPLHKLNPARLKYIEDITSRHFGGTFKGLTVLDIGCGGGLLSEPLARKGAKVVGIDASEEVLQAARTHAGKEKLTIDYQCASVEEFAHSGPKFDVVLAMEILEHVADVDSFLKSASALLKPEGVLIVSTVNRTTKSYLLGVVVAEYILGWVPAGMHDWNKFIRPSELALHLEKGGLCLKDLMGAVYNPLNDSFSLRMGKLDVNYLAAAVKSLRR